MLWLLHISDQNVNIKIFCWPSLSSRFELLNAKINLPTLLWNSTCFARRKLFYVLVARDAKSHFLVGLKKIKYSSLWKPGKSSVLLNCWPKINDLDHQVLPEYQFIQYASIFVCAQTLLVFLCFKWWKQNHPFLAIIWWLYD